MDRKRIRNGWIAMVVVVCLLIGFGATYKTMAGELRVSETEDSSTPGDIINFEMAGELTKLKEEEKETVVIPGLLEEEKEDLAEEKEEVLEEKEETVSEKKAEKKEEKQKEEKKKEEKKQKGNAFNVKLSGKDLKNLYRLVQSEVGNMDEKSKMLVASVVLNRVNDKRFPNTVSGVVLQKTGRTYQFSPVAPGRRFWTCTVSDATKKAVDKVLKNGDYSKGALYFVAKAYTTRGSWFDRNLKWLLHHGGQDYYKEF